MVRTYVLKYVDFPGLWGGMSGVLNLLAPVCFSASHVTYSTLRMEPVYMIIGQAAGLAAKLALESRKPVQNIDTRALTAKLRAQGAVMEWVKK